MTMLLGDEPVKQWLTDSTFGEHLRRICERRGEKLSRVGMLQAMT